MSRAIVIGGGFPQYIGRVVDIVEGVECVGVGMTYRTDPILRDPNGLEIYFQEQHLSILPPEETIDVEDRLVDFLTQ